MRECVEEGTLQAYFDGELSSEMMQRMATHLAACAQCAVAAREVETESLMIAEAFAPALAGSVPSERLRARLDAAISELPPRQQQSRMAVAESKGTRLRSWLGTIMAPFSLVPQHQAVGFASLIVVAVLGLIFAFVIMRPRPSVLNMASTARTHDPRSFEIEPNPIDSSEGFSSGRAQAAPLVKASAQRSVRVVNRRRNGSVPGPRPGGVVTPQPSMVSTEMTASVRLLPGEKSYLKAIASLDTAIKASGDGAMRPTLRAEYERNLQVVDEAIAQTRVMAQRNPNDKDATDFLLSAYQSKVDLLNTVAEQAQLSTVYR
jgi:hypothetical protein